MHYYPSQVADDRLLMRYTYSDYFSAVEYQRLAKNFGYSVWLFLVNKSGISIDIAQFLMWLIAGILVAYAFQRIFNLPWLTLFSFSFVLWNPLAFENWLGTRIYRNSIFPPVFFILLALLLIYVTAFKAHSFVSPGHLHGSAISNRKVVSLSPNTSTKKDTLLLVGFGVFSLALGLVTFFIYSLKEDMVWILPMVIVVVLGKMISVSKFLIPRSSKIIVILLCLIPFFSFISADQAYKALNNHLFGVSLLNTRTEGELAKFVSKIMMIDTADQSPVIWTPTSSIEKAWTVSPTLSKQEDMLNVLEHVAFTAPDIRVNPLKGDLLTWQLRFAISSTIGWQSERDIQALFKQINKELDKAFDEGKLAKTPKIYLTSSMVPRTSEEIWNLFPKTISLYKLNFDSSDIYESTHSKNVVGDKEPENVNGLLRLNIDPNNPNPQTFPFLSFDQAVNISGKLNKGYGVINIALSLVLLLITMANVFLRKWRDRRQVLFLLIAWALLVYSFVYCFAIQWFAEFLDNMYTSYFYAISCTAPFITIAILLGLGVTWKQVLRRKKLTNNEHHFSHISSK